MTAPLFKDGTHHNGSRASITSSLGFQARLTRSERVRAGIMAGAFGCALLVAIVRRALDGVVMSDDTVFYPVVGLLAFAFLFELQIVVFVTRALRVKQTIASWSWMVSAAFDLVMPLSVLALMQHFSPRGGFAALSGPSNLILPLVTMLSILRLRPKYSLWTGVGAGAGHWTLVTLTISTSHVDPQLWPALFSYGVYFALTGVGACIVASYARKYVEAAVGEAMDAEQSRRVQQEMERDLNVARDIQKSLMPTGAPSMPGFDIAGMARPAQQTGGDYYDWQMLADGRIVIALADVTGHGIGPALVMAVCRAYARAIGPFARDSASLLREVNTLIYDDLTKSGRFITMVVVILSPDGSGELVSAGHGPTLLYRSATGEIETFGGDGIPLGIERMENYDPSSKLVFKRGDVLLLSTDGFMEWIRETDGKQFGVDRMHSSLRASASGSAKNVLDELNAGVLAFAQGTAQQDDTTAVAIKRL